MTEGAKEKAMTCPRVQHTMNGDERNGWYCYACSFFTRNVDEASEHDGTFEERHTEPAALTDEAREPVRALDSLLSQVTDDNRHPLYEGPTSPGGEPAPDPVCVEIMALNDELQTLQWENADLRRQNEYLQHELADNEAEIMGAINLEKAYVSANNERLEFLKRAESAESRLAVAVEALQCAKGWCPAEVEEMIDKALRGADQGAGTKD